MTVKHYKLKRIDSLGKHLFAFLMVALSGLWLSAAVYGAQNFFYLINDPSTCNGNASCLLVAEDAGKAFTLTKGQKSFGISDVTVSSDGGSVFAYSQDAVMMPYVYSGGWCLQMGTIEVSTKNDTFVPSEDGTVFTLSFEDGYAMLRESDGSRYMIYDDATSSFKLGDKARAKLRLYQEDIYSLEMTLDGNNVSFRNNETLWSNEYFHVTYLINNGENVTIETLKAEGHVVETTDGVPAINVVDDGSTIWAVVERWLHDSYNEGKQELKTRSPLFRGSLIGESLTEGFGHDAETAYKVGEPISFTRSSGIRIIYTLDGSDPIKEKAGVASARVAAAGDHDGVVYDLDESPLKFDGSEMAVTYRALKAGYRPSEPVVFTVGRSGDVVTSVEMVVEDEDSAPVYYNLCGQRVNVPGVPGVYVRVLGGKATKVAVK